MTNSTNTQAAGTDGASLESEHHSNNQVLNDEKAIAQIPGHAIQTAATQTRAAGLNQETVEEYAKIMADSENAIATFPPPVVYFDGTNYWSADGAHRLAAAKRAGFNYIKCEVRPGSQRDALRLALKANATHGLKRSNQDKRFAIRLVLADEEWGKLSANVIAGMCGVTAPTVASVIKELAASARDSDSTVKVLQLNPSKRLGADGKLRPATYAKQPISESDPGPESGQLPEADEIDPESEHPADDDEFDTSKLEAAGLSKKMAAVVMAAKSKNGKPVVCSISVQKTLTNLSTLSRQLHELGLFKKYNAAVSAIIRDVKESGNLKQTPVAEPAPF